ncbi:acyl-CoA-binding protein [Ferruginibacter sp.]|uniref:acyl-CoA-binding protein n=1 Tax=Ferruginibacter sp. TaxID=1940288 RepID=UPI00265B0628|nr:acyl-CoA-binding protein [Ferruginibacter sp.]
MELGKLFDQAVINSKTLTEKPANDVLLQLYALFKQSTQGDIEAMPVSNQFDFITKAKYGAWQELKGKSKDTAMQKYIALIAKLK